MSAGRRQWRRLGVEPLTYNPGVTDRVSVRVSSGARSLPPQRMYGSEHALPPVWPDELKTISLAKPRQEYGDAERRLAKANGWSVLRGPYPDRFGNLSFADVTRIVKCPSVFIRNDGECAALLVYGPLLPDDSSLAPLGDVVIDLLPMPEPAFLIRVAPIEEPETLSAGPPNVL